MRNDAKIIMAVVIMNHHRTCLEGLNKTMKIDNVTGTLLNVKVSQF
jgi:hypothetical protein